jgi:hypothetical protein
LEAIAAIRVIIELEAYNLSENNFCGPAIFHREKNLRQQYLTLTKDMVIYFKTIHNLQFLYFGCTF